jgi:gliding motility associated protien GldN
MLFDLATIGPDKQGFGEIKMYRTDSLTQPMNLGDYEKMTTRCEDIEVQDTTTDDIYAFITVTVCTPYDYTEIKRFEITEDWFFDKQRGMYFPRIVSVAPLFKQNIGGLELSERPIFYLSYKELRPYLVHEEVFNRQNNAMPHTYFDFFERRQFASYITKESNMYGLAINQMPEYAADPMGALYESERIRQDLMEMEMDFWEE